MCYTTAISSHSKNNDSRAVTGVLHFGTNAWNIVLSSAQVTQASGEAMSHNDYRILPLEMNAVSIWRKLWDIITWLESSQTIRGQHLTGNPLSDSTLTRSQSHLGEVKAQTKLPNNELFERKWLECNRIHLDKPWEVEDHGDEEDVPTPRWQAVDGAIHDEHPTLLGCCFIHSEETGCLKTDKTQIKQYTELKLITQ